MPADEICKDELPCEKQVHYSLKLPNLSVSIDQKDLAYVWTYYVIYISGG